MKNLISEGVTPSELLDKLAGLHGQPFKSHIEAVKKTF